MEQRALTVDNQTRASNPGRFRVQYPVFVRCFPRLPLFCGLAVLLSAALVLQHWIFAVLALLLAGLLALWLVRLREHFQHGCVNPAKVVSHRPDRIAVITDLTTGKSKAPVIKVLPQPLGRAPGGRPPIGMRLATVALYSGSGERGQWDNFYPVAVNCASADADAVRTVMATIPPLDWIELEEGLRQVPNVRAPGLYRIDLSGLEREMWAVQAGLNRTSPTDTCSVLCPVDDRAGVLRALREVFPRLDVTGDETRWTAIAIRGAHRDLQLTAMTRQEAAAGLESMVGYFQRLPCPFADKQDWCVAQARGAQVVIVCNGAPRFEQREGHFHAISRITRQVDGAIVVGRAMVDGHGRVILNGDARGPS